MSANTQSAPDYVIRGGHEGKRRLELLSRILWPTTYRHLKRAAIANGMHCLDLGCGGGDVTLALARLVGPAGRVVGIDLDGVKLQGARTEATHRGLSNVEFRQANIDDWSEDGLYDRIYSRFLLTHLPDCDGALAKMRHALRPGGLLILEDIDFAGSFCDPPNASYQKYVDLYRAVVRCRQGDADIGPKLYRLLLNAGLQDIQMDLVHPFHTTQEGKDLSLSTLINIGEAVISEGLATTDEMDRTIADLADFTNDPRTLVSLPRIFQARARRA